jgi:S-adenosylmethionine hydrolase
MNQPAVVALLSDFGLADPYVGIMKGVLLSKAPNAQLVDLAHQVPPQSVVEAAFLLQTAWRYFPPETVFLVVVDPGVGGSRRRIAISAHGMTVVAPDNGCLSCVLSDDMRGVRQSGEGYAAQQRQLNGSAAAVSIENTELLASSISATFEGRDVFAPAAGFLAAGGSFGDLGAELQDRQALPAFRGPKDDRGHLSGVVIHIDTYGNLVTDIRGEDVTPQTRFLAGGAEVRLVRTYSEAPPNTPVAIIGSSGYVEIAVANGSAAHRLQAAKGDEITALA